MMRLQSYLFAALTAVTLFACNKPTDDQCRKAIGNMRTLMGTDNLRDNDGVEGEVRRCKGGSSKKSVQCAVKATSLDDLRKCEFFKVPENAPGIGAKGSAAPVGSAGSAAAGSAAAGSDSATGSGSASGSGSAAATGSGSAAATGSGSAAATGSGSAAATGSAAAPGSAAATGSAAAGSGSAH